MADVSQQIAEEKLKLEQAKAEVENVPTSVTQTQAQLLKATPASQAQVQQTEIARAISKQEALQTLKEQEASLADYESQYSTYQQQLKAYNSKVYQQQLEQEAYQAGYVAAYTGQGLGGGDWPAGYKEAWMKGFEEATPYAATQAWQQTSAWSQAGLNPVTAGEVGKPKQLTGFEDVQRGMSIGKEQIGAYLQEFRPEVIPQLVQAGVLSMPETPQNIQNVPAQQLNLQLQPVMMEDRFPRQSEIFPGITSQPSRSPLTSSTALPQTISPNIMTPAEQRQASGAYPGYDRYFKYPEEKSYDILARDISKELQPKYQEMVNLGKYDITKEGYLTGAGLLMYEKEFGEIYGRRSKVLTEEFGKTVGRRQAIETITGPQLSFKEYAAGIGPEVKRYTKAGYFPGEAAALAQFSFRTKTTPTGAVGKDIILKEAWKPFGPPILGFKEYERAPKAQYPSAIADIKAGQFKFGLTAEYLQTALMPIGRLAKPGSIAERASRTTTPDWFRGQAQFITRAGPLFAFFGGPSGALFSRQYGPVETQPKIRVLKSGEAPRFKGEGLTKPRQIRQALEFQDAPGGGFTVMERVKVPRRYQYVSTLPEEYFRLPPTKTTYSPPALYQRTTVFPIKLTPEGNIQSPGYINTRRIIPLQPNTFYTSELTGGARVMKAEDIYSSLSPRQAAAWQKMYGSVGQYSKGTYIYKDIQQTFAGGVENIKIAKITKTSSTSFSLRPYDYGSRTARADIFGIQQQVGQRGGFTVYQYRTVTVDTTSPFARGTNFPITKGFSFIKSGSVESIGETGATLTTIKFSPFQKELVQQGISSALLSSKIPRMPAVKLGGGLVSAKNVVIPITLTKQVQAIKQIPKTSKVQVSSSSQLQVPRFMPMMETLTRPATAVQQVPRMTITLEEPFRIDKLPPTKTIKKWQDVIFTNEQASSITKTLRNIYGKTETVIVSSPGSYPKPPKSSLTTIPYRAFEGLSTYAGTGQYELTAGGLMPGTQLGVGLIPVYKASQYLKPDYNIKLAEILSTKVQSILKPSLKLMPEYKVQPALRVESFTLPSTRTQPAAAFSTKTQPVLRAAPKVTQSLKLTPKVRAPQITVTTPTGRVPPPTLVPTIIKLPPRIKSSERKISMRRISTKKEPVFVTEIRRRGKFKPIAISKTPQRAIEIGKIEARKTLAASFRVKGAKGLVPLQPSSAFRSGKTPGTLVQKAPFRLSAKSEVKEIISSRRGGFKLI